MIAAPAGTDLLQSCQHRALPYALNIWNGIAGSFVSPGPNIRPGWYQQCHKRILSVCHNARRPPLGKRLFGRNFDDVLDGDVYSVLLESAALAGHVIA